MLAYLRYALFCLIKLQIKEQIFLTSLVPDDAFIIKCLLAMHL